jgi:D-alanine--poly(phosphoribitol) ligase subunit 1
MASEILDRLAGHASRQPHHPAVVEGPSTLSYGALVDRAKRLAAAIAAGPERPKVLIHLPQGGDAYCAMYATLMAGGYYAPTNVASPPARLRRIVDEFAPDVVVTSRERLATLQPPCNARLVDPAAVRNERPLEQSRPPHPLAYVIFTSGSTGDPKGVVVPRSALEHFVDWALSAMQVRASDRWSQHPNIAFDLSVLDIYGALCGGATLFPLSRDVHRLFPGRAIEELGLTIWNSVPGVVSLMMRAGDVREDRLRSLRLMTFCGEPLTREHLDALFAARPDLAIHNTYGPTEATVSCTLQRLTSADYRDACRHSAALGEAIPGMALHLLPAEAGAWAEVALSGPQLAVGYWNDPDSTARAFVRLSIDGRDVRCYRTGDVVERVDGRIYFLGRMDTQVKVGGRRVELEEINVTLRRCGYSAAATLLIGGELHAFVETHGELDEEALKRRIADHLEIAARPSRIHAVRKLPRNDNDKLDVRALSLMAGR